MSNRLPQPRGPISEAVIRAITTDSLRPLVGLIAGLDWMDDDPLTGEDSHLALHCCYELFHDGYDGVDERWEWEPGLLALRRGLEDRFLDRLRREHGQYRPPVAGTTMEAIDDLVRSTEDAPSPSRYLAEEGSVEQLRELLIHRSIYQLKEADAHTFGIPRLRGAAKSAMVAIQAEEYGDGIPGRTHAELFATTMQRLGLDPTPGEYIDLVPGVTLATDNLSSMFGLHRALRGALVGHLATFETTSAIPMSRYAAAIRRLTGDDLAAEFYDVHVEADAGHELIAGRDLVGGLVTQQPHFASDVLFGAGALMNVEGRLGIHLLEAWEAGRSSLSGSEVLGPSLVPLGS